MNSANRASPNSSPRMLTASASPSVFWSHRSGSVREHRLATRLTQRHKREARDQISLPAPKPIPRPEKTCRNCGTRVNPGSERCLHCSIGLAKDQFAQAAKSGRVAAQSAEAQMRRAATQRQQVATRKRMDRVGSSGMAQR